MCTEDTKYRKSSKKKRVSNWPKLQSVKIYLLSEFDKSNQIVFRKREMKNQTNYLNLKIRKLKLKLTPEILY